MRHNILLDSSLTGSPFHSLRAILWNVRALGIGWWLRCLILNAGITVIEFAVELGRRTAPPQAAHAEAILRPNDGARWRGY
jgi:hypothetical protein